MIKLINSIKKLEGKAPILFLADQDLQHQNLQISKIFSQYYPECEIFKAYMPKTYHEVKKEEFHLFFGYYSAWNLESSILPEIVFIGKQTSNMLLKIGLLLGKYKYKSFNIVDDSEVQVQSSINEVPTINKELMKRFVLIEKAKDKNIFAILINSATLMSFQETLKKVKSLLKSSNKKFYTIMINNITEAKLGNFPDIEVFVILSCHNHSLYAEKDFYRVIITPYELELALDTNKQWENCVLIDSSLGKKEVEEETKKEEILEKKEEWSLMLKNKNDQIQIREIFQTLDLHEKKNFKGLDQEQNVPISMAVQGLSGIASEYIDEKTKKMYNN